MRISLRRLMRHWTAISCTCLGWYAACTLPLKWSISKLSCWLKTSSAHASIGRCMWRRDVRATLNRIRKGGEFEKPDRVTFTMMDCSSTFATLHMNVRSCLCTSSIQTKSPFKTDGLFSANPGTNIEYEEVPTPGKGRLTKRSYARMSTFCCASSAQRSSCNRGLQFCWVSSIFWLVSETNRRRLNRISATLAGSPLR